MTSFAGLLLNFWILNLVLNCLFTYDLILLSTASFKASFSLLIWAIYSLSSSSSCSFSEFSCCYSLLFSYYFSCFCCCNFCCSSFNLIFWRSCSLSCLGSFLFLFFLSFLCCFLDFLFSCSSSSLSEFKFQLISASMNSSWFSNSSFKSKSSLSKLKSSFCLISSK